MYSESVQHRREKTADDDDREGATTSLTVEIAFAIIARKIASTVVR